MKRRFEVSYYECGLTRRISRRFFTKLIAYLYKGYLEYKYGEWGAIELKDVEYE